MEFEDLFFPDFDDIAAPPEANNDFDSEKVAEQHQVSTECPTVEKFCEKCLEFGCLSCLWIKSHFFSIYFDPQAEPKKKRAPTTCGRCNMVGHNRKRCPDDPLFIPSAAPRKKLKGAIIVVPIIEVPNIALNDAEEGSDNEIDIQDDLNDQLLIDEFEANEAENNEEEILPAVNVQNHLPGPSKWEKVDITERLQRALRSGEIVKEDPCPIFKPFYKVGPLGCEECRTPWEFLKVLIPDSIVMEVVRASNSYCVSTKISPMREINLSEMWTFIAIVLVMGINRVPERNYLWGSGVFASEYVKRRMTHKRFEQILRAFHWVDTAQISKVQQTLNNKKDHFWRIREFADQITVNFRTHYQCDQKIDIDEQCIPFKGRHPSKCYNPNKPSKWHLKVYAANDAKTSYQINLLLYQGKDEKRDKELTATEYPVHYLMNHEIFKNRNHLMFCDNWYSSINVVLICLAWGIHFVGTIKTNRSQLPKEGILPYKGVGAKARGFMHGFVNIIKGFSVYFYAWQDSKPVHMVSTIRSSWQNISRNTSDAGGLYHKLVHKQPTIIWLYNQGMGGTDQFDQKLSTYSTCLKVFGWHKKVMFHLIQCTVVNAHILQKATFELDRKDENFTLLKFMENLIEEIFVECSKDSTASEMIEEEKNEPLEEKYVPIVHYARTSTLLRISNRHIGDHFPVQYGPRDGPDGYNNRRKCRICQKKSNIKCSNTSCNVALCINDCGVNLNCWGQFHKKK